MPRACIRGKGGYRWTSTGVFKDSYPWIQMMYASDYTSRRVFRRFLQLGIAVVMPQAWGGQHKPESGDSWYWSDGDTEGKGAYDPQRPAGELGKCKLLGLKLGQGQLLDVAPSLGGHRRHRRG